MIEATLNYLAPMAERPYYYTYPPPEGERPRNTHGDRRLQPIHDAREIVPSLEAQGFALVRHATSVDNLWDPEQVREGYYPEVEALVAEATGASRVVAFDHNVRSESRAAERSDGAAPPVRFVHNDYTEASGPQRVRDLMRPDQVQELLARRFAVVNVWKPIARPVLQAPLGFCDAQTIEAEDRIPTDLRYRDRTGEIYSFLWSPRHRWYFYPEMQPDEALLLTCYDSAEGRPRFTAHSAFDDPNSRENAPARESIEVRTLAFFGA